MKLVRSKMGVLSRLYFLVVRSLLPSQLTSIVVMQFWLPRFLIKFLPGLSGSNTLPSSAKSFQRELAMPQEHVLE